MAHRHRRSKRLKAYLQQRRRWRKKGLKVSYFRYKRKGKWVYSTRSVKKRKRRRRRSYGNRRHHKYVARQPFEGMSAAEIARVKAEDARREAEYAKFDAARKAIAHRMGISSSHADAHYQALIEHYGYSPEKAAQDTWGWQD